MGNNVDMCEICDTKSEKLDVLTIGLRIGTLNKSGFIRTGNRVKVDERGVWMRARREDRIGMFSGYEPVGSCREEFIRNVLES